MSYKIMWVFAFVSFTSCQVYQSDFDCPPSKGVPCTSVSDIQKMILETPDGGPDIFSESYPSEFTSPCPSKSFKANRRIWVSESCDGNSAVQGHFIYFNDSLNEEVSND